MYIDHLDGPPVFSASENQSVFLRSHFSAGETLEVFDCKRGSGFKGKIMQIGLLNLVYLSFPFLPVFRFYLQDAVLFENNIGYIHRIIPIIKF